MPASYRPIRIEGDHDKGEIHLGDEQRLRLRIRWEPVRRWRQDADRLVRRHLQRSRGRATRSSGDELEPVENATFDRMVVATDATQPLMKCVAYARHTRRLVELTYYRGTGREDQQVKQRSFRGLIEQPEDRPQRWAYFDISFQAPARLRYQQAQLNIGDLSIHLQGPSSGRCRTTNVVVRQIYPAGIALQRQPLDRWMHEMVAEQRKEYRVPREQPGTVEAEALSTTLGEGLVSKLRLRPALRLIRWQQARWRAHWLIHDQKSNRLTALQVADDEENLQNLLQQLLEGLNWVGEATKRRSDLSACGHAQAGEAT